MKKLISRYRKAVQARCIGMEESQSSSVEYWQSKLFSSTIEFIIPFSMITLVPGVTYSLMVDLPVLAILDVLSFLVMLYIAFGKGASVQTRKFILILLTYSVAIYLLLYTGYRGPGFLFLYSACIFGIIILSDRYAYLWSWINVVICGLFAVVLQYDLSPIDVVNEIPAGEWIAVSVNLIFLSFVTSALLPILFSGLSKSFDRQRELQDELYQKKESLEAALKGLEQKNNDLEQFTYATSHDLQEPLRTITSFLTLLEKKYKASLDDTAGQYIHFAVDGAERMQRIIKDLLAFSKAANYDGPPELLRLSDIVEEVCQLQAKLIEEKNADVSYADLPEVKSHHSAMVQVLQNLIGNALKYSREGVPPKIEVTAKDLGHEWQIEVSDNGIGIDQEYFDRIFVIFQRLHNMDTYGGTGIGLATVKKIIEQLGGRVWVASKPKKGSIFYFTVIK